MIPRMMPYPSAKPNCVTPRPKRMLPMPHPRPNNRTLATSARGELKRSAPRCGTVSQAVAQGTISKPTVEKTSQVLSQCHADHLLHRGYKAAVQKPAINTPATPQPMFPSIFPPVPGLAFSLKVLLGGIELTHGLGKFIFRGNAVVPAGHVLHKADALPLVVVARTRLGFPFMQREVIRYGPRCRHVVPVHGPYRITEGAELFVQRFQRLDLLGRSR